MKTFLIILITGVLFHGFIKSFIKRIYEHIQKRKRARAVHERKTIALDTIAHIWAKRKDVEVSLQELTRLWKEGSAEPAAQGSHNSVNDEPVVFTHVPLNEFYEGLKDKSFFSGNIKSVITAILTVLDANGDSPSVVNVKGEAEAGLDKNAYDVLASVPLLRHTLHVSEEIVKLIPSGPMTPKAIITALGHDLGKIPAYRDKLYSMGDHPLISVTVLDQIEGFKNLPNADEIAKAIKDHHRTPKGLLAEKLKEADQNARRKEMAENLVIQAPLPSSPSQIPEVTVQASRPPERSEKPEKADIFGAQSGVSDEEIKLRELEIPWFDADEFISEMRPYVNRLEGGRWDAFSMPDGYVYFQTKILREVSKKLARKHGDTAVITNDIDEGFRRNLLLTIVTRLKEKDAIARELIKDGYFSAPFIVKMEDGAEIPNAFYTPFKAEVFAEKVSDLEVLKVGKLKKIASVAPKYAEPKTDIY